MTYSKLRVAVATLLDRTVASFSITESLVTVDLLEEAILEVQKEATLKHEFSAQEQQVSIDINQTTGTLISTAVLHGTATNVKVKRLVNAFLPYDNYQRPTKIITRDAQVDEQYRDIGYSSEYQPPVTVVGSDVPRITLFGDRVFLYPQDSNLTNPFTATFDAVIFPVPYAVTTQETDFLMEYGYDYLQWSAVKRLNYLVKHFVPRQEGNLVDLDKEIALGWQKLLSWDTAKSYSDSAIDLD